MGITLTSKTVSSTYDSLLKLSDNDQLTGAFKLITDGLGTDTGISINDSGDVNISGTLVVGERVNTPILQLTGGTGTQGTFSWNPDEWTVDLIQNGTTLQLGQEVQIHVKNQTGATIPDGTPVYATGTLGASGRITVAPMIANGTIDAKYFLGITTEDIVNGGDGKITTFGKIRGLNTSAYTEGQTLWVSSTVAGAFQTTRPLAPNLDLEVAIVINSHVNNGTIFVRANNGHYLGTAHDVNISSVAENDLLIYKTNRWVNTKSIGDLSAANVTVSGYLRGPEVFVIDPAAFGNNTGLVQILGDLRVDGVTTTINSTTISVSDKNITLAKDAVTAGDANGAGITIAGANATLTYLSATDDFTFNKNVNASRFVGPLTGDVTGTVSTLSNHDTDDLNEGLTNLYFTTTRARDSFSAGTGVAINAGEISIGQSVGTTDNVTFDVITATGGTSTEWNTAYDYSQVGHLPLDGKAADSELLDGIDGSGYLRVSPNSSTPYNGNFAIGNNGTTNFIQSHSSQTLEINPLGNAVTINGNAAIHAGNISSQSVNYAVSAGAATTSITFVSDRTNYKGYTDNAVSGQLMWKQYGNFHTIFDASAGTSPSGTTVNRHTPDYPVLVSDGNNSWGVNPNLMAWNGANTYGVKVDWSRYSEISGEANLATTANNALALSGYALDGATSVATRIFNNKGQVHGTYTDFNTAMTPGPNYLQGGTNGPTGTGQWYGFMLGLGNQYNTETGNTNSYASQLYWNRQDQGGFPYLYARDMEAGVWGSWRKMGAGYADTAGSALTADVANTANYATTSGTAQNADYASNSNLLDSLDSTQFLRSDESDVMTGNLNVVTTGNASKGTIMISGSKTDGANKFASIAVEQFASSAEPEGFAAFTAYSSASDNELNIGGGVWELNAATRINFMTYSSPIKPYGTGGNIGITINSSGLTEINPGHLSSKSFRVYYDMDVYNTINFTDAAYNMQSRIYGTSGNLTLSTSTNYNVVLQGADGYVTLPSWLRLGPGGQGIYSTTNGAHLYPNATSLYGQWRIDGVKNNYRGIFIDAGSFPHLMFDGSGNGGIYHQNTIGDWSIYHNISNNCVGIGGSSTYSGYKAAVNGNLRANGNVVAINKIITAEATYNGEFGSASFSWANSTAYPTIYSSHPDRWIMLCYPHISYLQNGVGGYTGTTTGSTINFGSDSAYGTNWGIGVNPNNKGSADVFSVTRGLTRFLDIKNGGSLKLLSGGITDSGEGRIIIPSGASYVTSSSVVVGAIKIALPTSKYKSNTMMTFKVVIYEYSTGRTYEYRISGYNYSDSGATWYNESAINISDNGNNHVVRFGHDGTRNCVWIGETTNAWSYPQVYVTDFTAGYSGLNSDEWGKGWSISFVSAFDSISRSRTPALIGKVLRVNNIIADSSGVAALETTSNQRYIAGFKNTSISESGYYPYLVHDYISQNDYGNYSSLVIHFNGVGDKFYFNRQGGFQADGSITANSNWFRTVGDGGLYFQSYGRGLQDSQARGNSYGNVSTYNSGHNGWDGWTLGRSNMSWMGTNTECGLYNADLGDWIVYYVESIRCVGIGTSTTSSSYKAYVGGSLYATGDIVAYSDRRVKENIVNIDSALDKVKALQGVYYNRINDKDKVREIGFIAQDVHDAVPELANYAEDVDEWGVKYAQVTGLHNEAIKELAEQLSEKDKQIANLQAQIDELKNLILNK